jgi:hypothetical protein
MEDTISIDDERTRHEKTTVRTCILSGRWPVAAPPRTHHVATVLSSSCEPFAHIAQLISTQPTPRHLATNLRKMTLALGTVGSRCYRAAEKLRDQAAIISLCRAFAMMIWIEVSGTGAGLI